MEPGTTSAKERHGKTSGEALAPAEGVSGFIEERNGHAYPTGSPLSVKHIAFLYAYQRKHPLDIVARYPKTLSHAQVHTALAHYYLHRERFDAEIASDMKQNVRDALSRGEAGLPALRLCSLVEAARDLPPQEW
jgi:hypothetical protein